MKDKLKLATLVCSKKNHAFWYSTILLTFMIAALFSVISILRLHQNQLLESRGNVYGYFHSIIYQLKDEIDESIPKDIMESAASIQVKQIKDKGFDVRIGCPSSAAESYVYRIHGKAFLPPLEQNECAISEAIADHFQKRVEDTIDLLGKHLTIKKIVPDIGLLWVRGEREDKVGMSAPNVWINAKTFEDCQHDDSVIPYRMLFLNPSQAREIQERAGTNKISGNLYENRAVTRDVNLFIFRFRNDFYLGLMFVFGLLFISVFVAFHLYSVNRYFIYGDLGMDDKTLATVTKLEYLFVAVPGLAIGSLIAALLTFFYGKMNYAESSVFSLKEHFTYTYPYALIYALAVLLCILFYSKPKRAMRTKLKTKDEIHGLPVKGKSLLALTSFLFLLITYMIFSFITSVAGANNLGKSFTFFGQIRQNYDFELKYVPTNFPPSYYVSGEDVLPNESDDGRFYFHYEYNHYNLDSMIPVIQKIKGVHEVMPFYENYHSFIKISNDVLSSPFLLKVQCTAILNVEDGPFKDRYVGQNLNSLVNCDVFTLPDSYLRDLGRQIRVTDAHLQALLHGEGVLLISPSIRIIRIDKDKDGEGILWERSSTGDHLLKDEELMDYKDATIYVPQAKKTLIGIVPQKALLEQGAELVKFSAPILGSSYDDIGWFPSYEYIRAPYRILTSRSYLEKQNLKVESSRLHVFLEEKADPVQVSNEIHKLTRKISNVEVTDQYYQVKAWHAYKFMEKVVIALYVLLFASIILAFIKTISQSFCLLNERFFTLYRDLGITQGKLFLTACKPFMITFFLSYLVQLFIDRLILVRFLALWGEVPVFQRMLGQFAIFAFYFLLFALMLFSQLRKLMMKQEYVE